MILSPTGTLIVRGPDPIARSGGAFGASRLRASGKEYDHTGTDLEVAPWSFLFCPMICEVQRVGISYAGDLRYHVLVLVSPSWYIKILYVWPYYQAGAQLRRGQVIGVAEDLTQRYRRVTNHIHLQVRPRHKRRWIDAMPMLEAA